MSLQYCNVCDRMTNGPCAHRGILQSKSETPNATLTDLLDLDAFRERRAHRIDAYCAAGADIDLLIVEVERLRAALGSAAESEKEPRMVKRAMTQQEIDLGRYIVQDGVPESRIMQPSPSAESAPQEDELRNAIIAYRREIERLKSIGLNQYGEVAGSAPAKDERLRELEPAKAHAITCPQNELAQRCSRGDATNLWGDVRCNCGVASGPSTTPEPQAK